MSTIDPMDLVVEPLSAASTLPGKWFVDPAILELELEFVFRRTWQLAGRSDQVSKPGAYFTTEVAGEPVIVVRGVDGALRALSNVCRHRAGPVAQGEGVRKVFRCAYHAWTYGLDGSLLGTPDFKGVEGFARERICLPSFQVDEWPPFVFVNLDPEAAPLSQTVTRLPEVTSHYHLSDLSFGFRQTYSVACNWKTYQINGLECYHCKYIHPDTVCKFLDVNSFSLEASDQNWLLWRYDRLGPPSGGDETVPHVRSKSKRTADVPVEAHRRWTPRVGLQGKEQTGYYMSYLFPNLMILLAPDYVLSLVLQPDGTERTVVMRDVYFDSASAEAHGTMEESISEYRKRVVAEDVSISEAAQRGLRSRYYTTGRLSVMREPAVHFFESRFRQALATTQHTVNASH